MYTVCTLQRFNAIGFEPLLFIPRFFHIETERQEYRGLLWMAGKTAAWPLYLAVRLWLTVAHLIDLPLCRRIRSNGSLCAE
jgi:hypothetical protein